MTTRRLNLSSLRVTVASARRLLLSLILGVLLSFLSAGIADHAHSGGGWAFLEFEDRWIKTTPSPRFLALAENSEKHESHHMTFVGARYTFNYAKQPDTTELYYLEATAGWPFKCVQAAASAIDDPRDTRFLINPGYTFGSLRPRLRFSEEFRVFLDPIVPGLIANTLVYAGATWFLGSFALLAWRWIGKIEDRLPAFASRVTNRLRMADRATWRIRGRCRVCGSALDRQRTCAPCASGLSAADATSPHRPGAKEQ
jgi:hypothetical protein